MTIPSLAAGLFSTNLNTNNLLSIGSQLTDLQQQLATGKVAQTYSALGAGRVTALEFQQRLTLSQGFQSTADQTASRLKLADSSLDQLNQSSNSFSSALLTGSYQTDASGKIVTQGLASYNFQQAVELLNTDYAGRYLFAGRASNVQPLTNSETILNGDSTHDGLKQILAERNQADLGIVAAVAPAIDSPSTGRLVLAGAGAPTTITEDVAGSPYGFKFNAANPPTSTNPNIAVSGPAGSPAGVSVNVTGQPLVGDSITITLTLPDATTTTLTLKATSSVTTNGAGFNASKTQFEIGATTAQTAANLNSAITLAINAAAATTLKAASSITAATNFFGQTVASPAQRVGTLPATTATTTTTTFAVGAKATIAFYNGEEQPTATTANIDTIRNSVPSRVDSSIAVGVGVQGNEPAFIKALAAFAVLAVEPFNTLDPNDKDHFQALATRAQTVLGNKATESIADVQVQLSNSAVAVKDAQTRLKQKTAYYQDLIDGVENADSTSISVQILSLQNRLQASYQTTSILSKLTLTQYLR
ncbi:MAG: hypothetical protein K2P80_08330 [Beijerinckiaceae bacterium]|nr:hypothetical protein [Beijerinckiaceae bacterium]